MRAHANRFLSGLFCCLLPFSLSGCLAKQKTYTGLHFPPAETVEVSFQENTVPRSCQGFAHLIASTAAPVTGLNIQEALLKEAREKGANRILIGMVREEIGNKPNSFRFDYFGPEYLYPFPQGWVGWKFGIQEWEKAGPLIGFGLNDWGNMKSRFDSSLKIQVAFLRCQ